MGFKTENQGANFAGVTIPTLEPNVYENGKILGFKKGTKTYNDEVTPTIDVILADKEGNKHISQEKEPEEDKQGSYFEKMLHILTSFMNEKDFQKAVKTEINSFEELQDWMIGLHEKHYPKDHTVDFKIEGSEYNGNVFTRLPNYNARYNVPFIKASNNKEIKLSFTNSELKGLAKYKAAKSGNANVSPDMGGGSTHVPDKPAF